MKAVLFFAVVCALAAVSQSKYCGGAMMNDPSTCTHSCPQGETKTCEHGGICTCANTCMMREDCISANVTCGVAMDPMHHATMREEAHCYDGICICMPTMHQGGMQPGGHHGGHN